MPIPIAFRVPRSPPVFVGREAELARVQECLRRGALAMITGVGGLGKTALASRTVEALGGAAAGIFVGLRARGDLPLELGRALAATEGFDSADWSASRSDPEAMIDAVIDLVEQRGHLIVVDDLHEGDELADACIRRVASICRNSRWIVTSRREPKWPGSEDVVVPLSGLTRAEVDSLIMSCAPHVDAAARDAIAEAASGSPWRARSGLRGAPSATRVTTGLTHVELGMLALLDAVLVPIPPALLLAGRDGDHAILDRLEREGLLQVGEASVRLHDVARTQLAGTGLPRTEPGPLRRLMRALLRSGVSDLEIEGARLWQTHGGESEDLDAVHGRATSWVECGLAERAYSVLEAAVHPRLVRERLTCAVALGTDAALAWANQQPEPAELDVKLTWATGLDRAGRRAEASAAARDVRLATKDPDLATRAGLIESEHIRLAGRYQEAERLLSELAPEGPGLRLLVEARRASLMAIAGRADEALALCRSAATAATARPAVERLDLLANVASVYAMLGRLSDVRALSRRIEADPARAPFATRSGLLREAVGAIEAGELREGRVRMERLGSTRGTSLRAHVLLNWIRLRVAMGDLAEIDELLEELGQLCERGGDGENLAWSRLADAYVGISVAIVRGRPWPPDLPPIRPALRVALDACLRIARRRLGRDVEAADPNPQREVDIELFRVRDLGEGHALEGRFDDAQRVVADAIDLARRSGYRLHEADLLALGCDVYTIGGDNERAAHFATELRCLAERMESPRFVAESELAKAVAARAPKIDRALLERLAASSSASPVAARRVGALLGREGPLDRFDTSILRSWRARAAGLPYAPRLEEARSERHHIEDRGHDDEGGWTFDPKSSVATLPGRVVDLGRHALLAKLVAVLLDHGVAGATKETLVRSAWDVRSHHPLRDDKRLYVAIRRLRVLLEEDPDHPARLVTTSRGYGLRGCAASGSGRSKPR